MESIEKSMTVVRWTAGMEALNKQADLTLDLDLYQHPNFTCLAIDQAMRGLGFEWDPGKEIYVQTKEQ